MSKKFLVHALAIAMLTSVITVSADFSDVSSTDAYLDAITALAAGLAVHSADAPFDDVEGHWAVGYINAAYRKEVIKGISVRPPLFEPEGLVTFEQAVTMVIRMLG